MPVGQKHVSFEDKRQALLAQLASAASASTVRLKKPTSNLFRDRTSEKGMQHLRVGDFNRVIRIDPEAMTADVEGMITYEALVEETLKFGLLPAVVPQLKTITLGGAVSGIGIEASSFRYGFVHETVDEMEILLGDGRIVVCNRFNEYKDLFFGFPNSYGTLGYLLRLKIKLISAKSHVELRHTRFSDPNDYFETLAKHCEENRDIADGAWDYIDGTIFSSKEMYITQARFRDDAPFVSDYKYMNIFYRSIQSRTTDYLTVSDYIWRWDADWFWCSKHFHVQNRLVRLLTGKFALSSKFYWKVMSLQRKLSAHPIGRKLLGGSRQLEIVNQDVEIPLENCAEFLSFLEKEIGIKPIWICPVRAFDPKARFDLYHLDAKRLFVNFGFWDAVPVRPGRAQGFYNRAVEQKVAALGGRKSLYSVSLYPETEFWEIYNGARYWELKRKYDSTGRFRDLFQKCVLRH